MYSNGYITFSSFYHYLKPSFANNHQIVAGYGTDLDFRNGIGGFSAAVHESNATDEISLKVFNETNNYLEKYANVTDFSPRTIILCTWYKASPYRASLSNKVNLIKIFYLMHSFDRIIYNVFAKHSKCYLQNHTIGPFSNYVVPSCLILLPTYYLQCIVINLVPPKPLATYHFLS